MAILLPVEGRSQLRLKGLLMTLAGLKSLSSAKVLQNEGLMLSQLLGLMLL